MQTYLRSPASQPNLTLKGSQKVFKMAKVIPASQANYRQGQKQELQTRPQIKSNGRPPLSARNKKDVNSLSDRQMEKASSRNSKIKMQLKKGLNSQLQLSTKKLSSTDQMAAAGLRSATGIPTPRANGEHSQVNLLELLNLDPSGFIKINSLFNGEINKDLIHKYNSQSIQYGDEIQHNMDKFSDFSFGNMSEHKHYVTPRDSQKNFNNSQGPSSDNKRSQSTLESITKHSNQKNQPKNKPKTSKGSTQCIMQKKKEQQVTSLNRSQVQQNQKQGKGKSQEEKQRVKKLKNITSSLKQMQPSRNVLHSTLRLSYSTSQKNKTPRSQTPLSKKNASLEVTKLSSQSSKKQSSNDIVQLSLKTQRSNSKQQNSAIQQITEDMQLAFENVVSRITPERDEDAVDALNISFSIQNKDFDNNLETPVKVLETIPEDEQGPSNDTIMQQSESTEQVKEPSLDLLNPCNSIDNSQIPNALFNSESMSPTDSKSSPDSLSTPASKRPLFESSAKKEIQANSDIMDVDSSLKSAEILSGKTSIVEILPPMVETPQIKHVDKSGQHSRQESQLFSLMGTQGDDAQSQSELFARNELLLFQLNQALQRQEELLKKKMEISKRNDQIHKEN